MNEKYTIGLDFGTRSARALLVRIADGEELGYTEYVYPHGIMDTEIPCGKKLESHWALQHPQDYLDAIKVCIPKLLKTFSIDPERIIGLGIDFTSCTVLPVTKDSTPLCFLKEFENEPHAYVKLWKHHAAQYCADIINQKAVERGESFLRRFGGKISSEFYFPKLLQLAFEAPKIFYTADLFIEAGDWIVWRLTGRLSRSASFASYKALWSEKDGYPSIDFLNSLKPDFGEKALSLVRGKVLQGGILAGCISKEFSKITGLSEKTAVCTCIIDAHSALPSAKITEKDEMLMILGTSGCHISLSDAFEEVPGICAAAKDGILPDFYGFESGQSGLGDHFEWMAKNIVSESISNEAKEKNIHVLDLLSQKASKQKPGEHGLIALDWFNGNRTVLTDSSLTGMILGFNLTTKPEDIYRALVEAIAFGTRKIIENYEINNIPINLLYACGSIAKNDFIMQVYSDVLGKEIKLAASENGSALGSAIFAAAAAGEMSIQKAAKTMGKLNDKVYIPKLENKAIYDKLYEQYSKLHDYFGRGENDVMKELLKLKKQ